MLKKSQRLSGKNFNRLYRKGRKAFWGPLEVRTVPNFKNLNRISVIVPLSYSKKAVERNYLRRKIYALFEKFLKENKLLLGQDIVVKIKNAQELDFEKEITKLLDKLGCLNISP